MLVYFHQPGSAIFAIIPVATVALLYGWQSGLLAGLASLPVSILLYQVLGVDWYHRMMQRGALIQGTIALIVLGFVLGRVSDLSRRLKRELSEKGRMEEELRRHRDNLEQQVQGKTAELQRAYQKLSAANEQLQTQYGQLKASQKELQESRDFLETVISNTTDGIIVTNDCGQIMLCNKPVELLFGRRRGELIGLPVETIFLLDPGMKTKAGDVTAAFYEKGHASYEMKYTMPGGELVHLDCTTTMIPNAAGTYIASITIMRNVTERRRMEQQIRQSQKLESIGTLAGGIAHDFNNILAAIIGYTELSVALAADNDQVRQNLGHVLQASQRAKNLVRQILSFSRRGEPERKPILPHVAIREVMKLMRATVPAAIEIQEDIPELPHVITGDMTELHQIVMNLCTNGVHAMQESGGVLRVSLAAVDISADEASGFSGIGPGGYVRLCVSDTGTGISPDMLGRVFDPFFTTKQVDRGTGMGLAVVHGIVKSYGGDIAVASSPGKGTTVSVLIPRMREPGC